MFLTDKWNNSWNSPFNEGTIYLGLKYHTVCLSLKQIMYTAHQNTEPHHAPATTDGFTIQKYVFKQ